MQLSTFLIRLIFLGLPGIIGSKLYQKLRGKPDRRDWEDVLEIILFALGSYALYGLMLKIAQHYHHMTSMLPPLQRLFDEKLQISWREVGMASLFGMVLPFIAAFINRRKIINGIGRLLHVTNRFGDEDVWDFFHNMEKPDWVFVRDHRENLVYYGWILVFSESDKDRELVMRDVVVYSNVKGSSHHATKPLYESELIYISRKPDELSIEVPAVIAT